MATPMQVSLHGRRFGLDSNGNLIGAGRASSVKTTAAAGGSNVAEVTFQVVDHEDNPVAGVRHIDIYLSDSSAGVGLAATSASGAVAAKAASGVDLQIYSAKKAFRVQTLANGSYVLSITDTGKTAFYPVANIGGAAIVGTQLVTGNYGA